MTTGDPSKWVFYLLETAIPTNEWGHHMEVSWEQTCRIVLEPSLNWHKSRGQYAENTQPQSIPLKPWMGEKTSDVTGLAGRARAPSLPAPIMEL